MNNNQGQVAGHNAQITLINLTKASEALVALELDIVKNKTNLTEAFCSLSPKNRKKSIVYRSLKKFLNFSQFTSNKENTEDILSEALVLLKEASVKFFQQNRVNKFEQFAIVHIGENIKKYLSKLNNMNSSDKNELIHTAIRIIRKKNGNSNLSYEEAKHLAKCFNLCEVNGYKKIWSLETLHHNKISLWHKFKNENNKTEEICIADKQHINLYNNNFQNDFNDPQIIYDEIEKQKEIDINKIILNNFKKNLEKRHEILIFEKRLYCVSGDPIKLKDIAKILGISLQRVATIENNLKKKLKIFFCIENKKITDIR
ncbi:hypothetical protein [Candidatus Pelagibacter sp.]|uniref:hypothetical protein n=1 Tax=Candidatus Pelagibacter sp. TaxID=2024849 RepID=UPI003F825491